MTKNSFLRCSERGAYVSALINQPWARDGRHCWRLVAEVQRDLFGRDLPPVLDVAPAGREGRAIKARLFAEHDERVRWREVSAPADGAIALMHGAAGAADAIAHAGVWLALDGGGVLHCDYPCGVVFDAPRELAMRRWVPRYFVPRDSCLS